MAHIRLLPIEATPLMLALAEACDPLDALGDVYGQIPVLDVNTPPALLPFLVWQYGLGELSPYLPNLYDLIQQGIEWQRVRGTPAAVAKALGWLGYAGTLDEEAPRRLRWNRFQLGLSSLPVNERPDLGRIEGVVQLSPPIRSNFGRGYCGFDVRAAEAGYQRYGGSILSDHSGVRIDSGAVQWSFGREHAFAYELTQADLTALGCWSVPAEPLGPWNVMNFPWSTANYPWWSGYAQTRRNTIVAALQSGRSLIAFRDASQSIIGYAPAIVHGVTVSATGVYQVNSTAYDVSDSPRAALAFCRTPFDAQPGAEIASVGIAFNATLASGVKPGKQWFAPADVTTSITSGWMAAGFTMAETIREHVVYVLDLDTH